MIAHWDDVEPRRVERGFLRATRSDLGRAAGSVGIGVQRIELGPGDIPTPVHVHAQEEEIFIVLEGSGLSWQDDETYELRAGDCLVHRVGEEEHTLRGGPDGLTVLAFGEREQGWSAHLPRAGVSWLFPTWVETGTGPTPWERELAAGPPDFPDPSLSPRPERILNVADCEAQEISHGDSQFMVRNLGVAVGSVRTGMRHHVLAPEKMGWPPHCHAAEEELFVVLEGEGTLLLGDERQEIELGGGFRRPAGLERIPVRAGHVIARPAGTRIAHAFVAGNSGLTYLAYGTRVPNDIAYYPRSNKVNIRGIGVIGRIERLEYWDGEP